MNDVMDRLRAADPLAAGHEPPSIARLREQLESSAERRGALSPAPHRPPGEASTGRRVLAITALALAAGVVALAIFGRGGGRLSLLARAYAATSPSGRVLHYAWSSRLVPARGASALYVEYRGQVWRSATRSRTLTEAVVVPRHGRREVVDTERVTERTASGERVSYWDGRTGEVSHSLERVVRDRPAVTVCTALPACAFSAEDPVSALRRLYPSLHERAGVFSTVGTPIGLRVYLDPHTGYPLRVVTRFAPGQPTPESTTVFHYYERLPLDAASEADLRMARHAARHRG
jgi:hypothetical protein